MRTYDEKSTLESLDILLKDIRPYLDKHTDEEIKNAITLEDYSSLIHIPTESLSE